MNEMDNELPIYDTLDFKKFNPDDDLAEKMKKLPRDGIMIYNEQTQEHQIFKNEQKAEVLRYVQDVVSAEIQTREMAFIGGAVNKADDVERATEVIKYTPGLNQSLSILSAMGSGYGYGFNAPTNVEARRTFNKSAWNNWASKVSLTDIVRNTIHSLAGLGMVWIEKRYDESGTGLSEKSWGISDLRVLSPKSMYNVIDRAGNILYYAQVRATNSSMVLSSATLTEDAFKAEVNYQNDLRRGMAEQLTVNYFDRHRILYMNYNSMYDNSVYGTGMAYSAMPTIFTKLGVQKKVLRGIDNAINPLVLIKYGTDKITPSMAVADDHFSMVKSKNPKYIKSQGWVSGEKIELGEHLDKIPDLLTHFTEEEKDAVFSIPALRGGATSGEGATIQMEVMQKMLMYFQNKISEKFRSEVFTDVLLGDPLMGLPDSIEVQTWQEVQDFYEVEDNKGRVDSIASLYPTINPLQYSQLPSLRWTAMESNADRRQRYNSILRNGGFGIDEMREESGYDPNGDYQEVPLIEMKRVKQESDIANKERELAIREREIDLQEKQLELERERMAMDAEQARRDSENSNNADNTNTNETS